MPRPRRLTDRTRRFFTTLVQLEAGGTPRMKAVEAAAAQAGLSAGYILNHVLYSALGKRALAAARDLHEARNEPAEGNSPKEAA